VSEGFSVLPTNRRKIFHKKTVYKEGEERLEIEFYFHVLFSLRK